jgi:3-oxoadipate enol-lactonase
MQFEVFADQHEVVRFDRRGFGRSEAPTGPFSDLRDPRDPLSALGIARCAVVGCADGAALAIDLVLADHVERTIRAGDAEGAVELQLAVWALVNSKVDPGVRKVAFENALAQRIDPSWREPPPPAVDRLRTLRTAALLVVGEEDIAEVGEIADLVAQAVPRASRRVVAEADQLVNVGEPERFNRLALDFLAFAG